MTFFEQGKLIRLAMFFLIGLMGAGCAVSRQHLGVHYMPNDKMWFGMVSEKVDGPTAVTEEQFVRGLVNNDKALLQSTLSDKLKGQFNDRNLEQVLSDLKQQYSLNGKYDRIIFTAVRPSSLDEGVTAEPFEYYDFVSARFLLRGQPDVTLEVYSTAIGADVKVCGFSVFKDEPRASEPPPRIRYIASESMDRAKISGRMLVIGK